MTDIEKHIKNQRRLAKWFFGAGGLIAAAGILLERTRFLAGFDPRLVTGAGILVLGVGLSAWTRTINAYKSPQDFRRTISAETDERIKAIKNKAGQRGFWSALAITYALLMWESLAAIGSLPELMPDARWYWLAAAVVMPMAVYIISITLDNRVE